MASRVRSTTVRSAPSREASAVCTTTGIGVTATPYIFGRFRHRVGLARWTDAIEPPGFGIGALSTMAAGTSTAIRLRSSSCANGQKTTRTVQAVAPKAATVTTSQTPTASGTTIAGLAMDSLRANPTGRRTPRAGSVLPHLRTLSTATSVRLLAMRLIDSMAKQFSSAARAASAKTWSNTSGRPTSANAATDTPAGATTAECGRAAPLTP